MAISAYVVERDHLQIQQHLDDDTCVLQALRHVQDRCQARRVRWRVRGRLSCVLAGIFCRYVCTALPGMPRGQVSSRD